MKSRHAPRPCLSFAVAINKAFFTPAKLIVTLLSCEKMLQSKALISKQLKIHLPKSSSLQQLAQECFGFHLQPQLLLLDLHQSAGFSGEDSLSPCPSKDSKPFSAPPESSSRFLQHLPAGAPTQPPPPRRCLFAVPLSAPLYFALPVTGSSVAIQAFILIFWLLGKASAKQTPEK